MSCFVQFASAGLMFLRPAARSLGWFTSALISYEANVRFYCLGVVVVTWTSKIFAGYMQRH